MTTKLTTVLIACIAFSTFAIGQTKPLRFVRYVNNDAEVSRIYDSLNLPLLVIGKGVYIIDADCISSKENKSGKTPNARNDGGDVTARKSRNEGGDVAARNARNEGGDVTARNARNEGGDVTAKKERNEGGDVTSRNTRNEGGDVTARKARNDGGDIGGGCGCEINNSGKFIIDVPSVHKKEEMRVYFQRSFIDKNLYKIKTV
jgi:hypothetical protein